MEPLTLQTAFSVLEQAARSATAAECPKLVGELERIKAMVWARIMGCTGSESYAQEREDDLLTIPQVAARLKMSPYRAYELARQGKLKSVRIGKLVRVTPEAIRHFVDKTSG